MIWALSMALVVVMTSGAFIIYIQHREKLDLLEEINELEQQIENGDGGQDWRHQVL